MKTNFTDRSLPPQSIESEESILGGILIDPNAMKRVVATGLVAEDFYVQAHRTIYMTMMMFHAEGKPVDLGIVSQALRDSGRLEKVGGTTKLIHIIDQTVSAVNVDQYAELVRKKSFLRKAIALGNEIIDAAYQFKAQPEAILDKLRDGKKSLSDELTGDRRAGLSPLAELVAKSYEDIEEAMSNRDNPNWRGEVKSGFVDLDKVCVGFAPKDLIVIGGRPGMGKTTFMQNLAVNIAREHGHVLSFHFGELSKHLVTKRILSQQSGVGLTQLRNGYLTEKNLEHLMQGIERTANIDMSLDDKPRDMDSVNEAIERWQDVYDAVPKAIFLDYAQIIKGSRGNSVERLEDILNNAKYLAGDFDCPVFIGSQINRETESKTDKRPSLAELKGCGGIEEKAQHVLLLYRDEYYNRENSRFRNVLEVNVAKCTNGEPSTVQLHASMETFTFGNKYEVNAYA